MFSGPDGSENAFILMKLRMFLASEPVSTSPEHALVVNEEQNQSVTIGLQAYRAPGNQDP